MFLSALRVRGPLKVDIAQDSISRLKIFGCYPQLISEELDCARENIGRLAQRAFRRPVTDALLKPLMEFL